jgi:hypothetical protein
VFRRFELERSVTQQLPSVARKLRSRFACGTSDASDLEVPQSCTSQAVVSFWAVARLTDSEKTFEQGLITMAYIG